MGCESGRQDSNLRPLVPQTSTYFPIGIELEFEGFRRETVVMTIRPCLLESVGIASTPSAARTDRLFRSSRWSASIQLAEVTVGAIRLLVAAGPVTGPMARRSVASKARIPASTRADFQRTNIVSRLGQSPRNLVPRSMLVRIPTLAVARPPSRLKAVDMAPSSAIETRLPFRSARPVVIRRNSLLGRSLGSMPAANHEGEWSPWAKLL
jgi:hypothetical protein